MRSFRSGERLRQGGREILHLGVQAIAHVAVRVEAQPEEFRPDLVPLQPDPFPLRDGVDDAAEVAVQPRPESAVRLLFPLFHVLEEVVLDQPAPLLPRDRDIGFAIEQRHPDDGRTVFEREVFRFERVPSGGFGEAESDEIGNPRLPRPIRRSALGDQRRRGPRLSPTLPVEADVVWKDVTLFGDSGGVPRNEQILLAVEFPIEVFAEATGHQVVEPHRFVTEAPLGIEQSALREKGGPAQRRIQNQGPHIFGDEAAQTVLSRDRVDGNRKSAGQIPGEGTGRSPGVKDDRGAGARGLVRSSFADVDSAVGRRGLSPLFLGHPGTSKKIRPEFPDPSGAAREGCEPWPVNRQGRP